MYNLSDTFFRSVHKKAAFLDERFAIDLIEGQVPDELTLSQIIQWSENVSTFEKQKLGLRRKWITQEREQLHKNADQYSSEQKNLSGWVNTLKQILLNYSNWNEEKAAKHPVLQKNSPVPFEIILIPWLDFAFQQTASDLDCFSPKAESDLAHFLLKDLSRLAAPCFQEAFLAFKKDRVDLEFGVFDAFQKHMMQSHYAPFFTEYASLSRLLVKAIDRWLLSRSLLFSRIKNDYHNIQSTFFKDQNIGQVVKIESNLSTPHSNEGQVHVLHFSSRQRILYKPRSAAQDVALEKIFDWLNYTADLLHLKAAKTIDLESYSWQEFIPYKSCSSQRKISQYYERCGQLAALFFALGSTDYHFGNLHARGSYPILTDNETLFSAQVRVSNNFSISGDQCLDEQMFHSLSHGHFLIDSARLFFPKSPSIVGVFEDLDRHLIHRFYPINKDNMTQRRSKLWRSGSSLAKLKGKKIEPYEYVEDVRRGYKKMADFIQIHHQSFLKKIQTITNDYSIKFRMLIRPSAWYHELLLNALSPELCKNGIDRSIHFEQLASFYMNSSSVQEVQSLLSIEKKAVKGHLIPWFHFSMDQQSLAESNHKKEASIIKHSSESLIKHRISLLKHKPKEDINQRIIKHYLRKPSLLSSEEKTNADILENLYFCYNNFFDVNTVHHMYGQGQKLYQYYTLDDGIAGVILLFSAWYHLKRDDKFKDLALRLLEPLKQMLLSRSINKNEPVPVGALKGIGSAVLSLVQISNYLEEHSMLPLAEQLLILGKENQIKDYSYASGQAGFLHALLTWSKASESRHHHKFLSEQLDKLLMVPIDQLPQRLGFSAGISGIVYTASMIAEYLADHAQVESLKHFISLCQNAMERNDIAHDLSFDSGLSGLILADHTTRKFLNVSLIPKGVKLPVKKLARITTNDVDHIKFGIAGRLEALQIIYKDHKETLEAIHNAWDSNFQKIGKYKMSPHYLNPSFYTGISGILYQKLRLQYPDKIHSLWL